MKEIYILFGLLPILQISAAEVMSENKSGEFFKYKSNSHTSQGKRMSSHSLDTIDFEEFSVDPHEREQEYQRHLKLGNFPEAAIALLGAAINGDSDSMDYVLKLDTKAFDYIRGKDLQNTQLIISKIADDLKQ